MKLHHPNCASHSFVKKCLTPERCLRYAIARAGRKIAVAKRRRFKGW